MIDRIYSMLGLCMKAGKIAYGSDMCEEKIKCEKVSMLIVAEDASKNTKERFRKLCDRKIKYWEFGKINEISHYIGKENKAVIGIMDDGFSKKINELMEESLKGANN
ncbi:MAG: ribosomal L7Ae/L30e/S12e/Gadd45 family protein [Clostridia bacterium]|nr:ribosomal L7Ae/L30e/S12e/Gadd45 family protein [Clostridia bacterium]MBR2290117.1 ribosomal L7Ae/L30e/S12e/Gadd45 family protein [Clostridia bacterium]